ncbi:MAG: M20/M25/M40 family metallo-hydrolase [Myxococcota bacterium]
MNETPAVNSENPRSLPGRSVGLAALLLAVSVGLIVLRHGPIAALPDDAPADRFSAARALAIVKVLLAEDVPHPIGSPANARVRDRIRARFAELGIATELQRAAGCSTYGECATVENILARIPGREGGLALLLLAHYDSVPAAPGAGDDASGVATLLEVARALRAGPALRHPVYFLVTDGEEIGLVGAEAFVRAHPRRREVAAVLNFEARGTSGASLLFQTGPASGDLVRLYGQRCPRPHTGSVFTTVYERMPNDTDLSVFIRAGLPGLNFAFTRDEVHYHSPLDRPAQLDARSIQHHGSCALALARVLAEGELPPVDTGRWVFFDWAGLWLVRWPEGATLPIAVVLAAIWVGFARRFLVRRALRPAFLAWGLGAALLYPLVAALSGAALVWALQTAHGVPAPWTGRPGPAVAMVWCGSFAAASWLAQLLAGRIGLFGQWLGAAGAGAASSLAFAAWLPGASYVVVVPLAASLLTLALVRAPFRLVPVARAALVPALVAAPILLSLALSAGETVGLAASPLITLALGSWFASFSPLVVAAPRAARLGLAGGLTLACAASGIIALAVPAATPERPRSLALVLHESASGGARWLASTRDGPLPPALAEAGGFGEEVLHPFPFFSDRWRAAQAPAERTGVPPPELDVLGQSAWDPGTSRRRIRLRLRSRREAAVLGLALPPAAEPRDVSMGGVAVAELSSRALESSLGWHVYVWHAPPKDGIEVDLTVSPRGSVEAFVFDQSYGLPANLAAEKLRSARPARVVAKQSGDLWLLTRAVVLPSPHP